MFVNRFFAPDQSATSQLLGDLAAALVKAGFDVDVVSSRQRYDDATVELSPCDCIAGVSVHRVWTSRFGRARLAGRSIDYLTFYVTSVIKLWRLLRTGDVVVVKTDPPLLSILVLPVARLKNVPMINWLQDVFPEVATALGANPLPKPADALLRRCRDWALKGARGNVVLGERMREFLQRLGVPDLRVEIIENWAELEPEPPKPVNESRLRSSLGLSREFVVGYSGNLGRAHEFQTVLAAAELLREDPSVVFLMIGSGVGMTALRDESRRRGLGNLRFLPYRPRAELGDSLAAADVHWVSLLSSLEGYIVPSKFYGILAAARPVIFIGDSDGELARVIRRTGCGAIVNAGAGLEFAEIIRAWKNDPACVLRMGASGHACYADNFPAGRAFLRWERLLRGARSA